MNFYQFILKSYVIAIYYYQLLVDIVRAGIDKYVKFMQKMFCLKASSSTSLQHLQQVRIENGPPLPYPLGKKLYF
jgi:hypothetical protein